VVLGERERLRQQIADRRLVVHYEHARTAGHRHRRRFGRAGRGAGPAARALRLEPRVDVALAEPPLAPHADRGDLACFDQAIDRAQIDRKVLESLFGREKTLVHHDAGESALTLPPSDAGADGSSMWKTAPPSRPLSAVIVPPWS